MTRKDYCVFILTHGRPDAVLTVRTLERCGYTGPVFIVIDDEDSTADRYRELYGEQVLMFSKEDIARKFDQGDNFKDRRTIVFARNACFELAEQVGYKYFIQLDDDYTRFQYRFNHLDMYIDRKTGIHSLDKIFTYLLDYYDSIPALSIAIGQGGDYIGGSQSTAVKSIRMRRKAMNSFICSTDRPFQFMGRINEDVNAYTSLARVGKLFLTTMQISLTQVQTQATAGGMTEVYLDSGTYLKSFYSVMFTP